jgi:hypothetical protein
MHLKHQQKKSFELNNRLYQVLQFSNMVDWSIDEITTSDLPAPVRKLRQPVKPKSRGPFGIRKSKPLVEYSERHFLHSGQKKNKLPALKIRKVKRDSFGNILNSAK